MTQTQRGPWHLALLTGLTVFLFGIMVIQYQDGHTHTGQLIGLATIWLAIGTALLGRRHNNRSQP